MGGDGGGDDEEGNGPFAGPEHSGSGPAADDGDGAGGLLGLCRFEKE